MRFPRPRYSLRTLFVVVTVLAGVLAFFVPQYRIVSKRKELLARPEVLLYSAKEQGSAQATETIPIVRQWLGDEAIDSIFLPYGGRSELLAQYVDWFPEAEIDWY